MAKAFAEAEAEAKGWRKRTTTMDSAAVLLAVAMVRDAGGMM